MNGAEKLLELAVSKGITASVAESCTGGLLGGRITSVPGSSEYFAGGVIAYSNRIKERILNVSAETLANFGAVSEQCAREMVVGVRELFGTELGIAITGIAGPSGGTADKPVGTVYIAVALGDRIVVERFRFGGDREAVRSQSVEAALEMAVKLLEG